MRLADLSGRPKPGQSFFSPHWLTALSSLRGGFQQLGKRIVETRLYRDVTIREENSIAALEVMSRYSTDPHWLIYLPPTMSPSETASRPDYLEYPTEVFEYFRRNGVQRVAGGGRRLP
jgi:hypothetical protein